MPTEPPTRPLQKRIAAQPEAKPEPGIRKLGPHDGLALPHERDETPKAGTAAPDPVMVQAKRDIDAGMVDTDMHATPGLDAELRARLVPGPGGKPPSSRRR